MYTDIHKSLSYETFVYSLNWNTECYTKTVKIRLKEESWFACFLMDLTSCIIWPCPPGLDVCGESPDPCITQPQYFKLETLCIALFFILLHPSKLTVQITITRKQPLKMDLMLLLTKCMVPSTLNFARGSSSKKSESAMLTETFATCFKHLRPHIRCGLQNRNKNFPTFHLL
jgi:hypothetical protein